MAKYLIKANDHVLSHCKCAPAIAGPPFQADCPWCGCGWMICCMQCGKGFIFAQVVEDDLSYDQLERMATSASGPRPTSSIQIPIDWAEDVVADFAAGQIVIYLDGEYWPIDSTDIAFEGWFAKHQLDRLPHAVALEQPGYLQSVLADPTYWWSRERPDRHDEE